MTEDAEIELAMTLKSEVIILVIINKIEIMICFQVETFPFDPSTDLPTGVELQDLIDQAIKLNSNCLIRILPIDLSRWAQWTTPAAPAPGAHLHLTSTRSTTKTTRKTETEFI